MPNFVQSISTELDAWMANDNRLVTECRSRAEMPAGGRLAAVGNVSSVTWTIGISVEANLWPSLVVKGLDHHETNHVRLHTTHPIRKSVGLCACSFVRSGGSLSMLEFVRQFVLGGPC